MPNKTRRVSAKYVERGLEHFHASLRVRELRSSRVRDAVARCALAQNGTFCALDLVNALRHDGVREAHEASVYRAMPLLEETGLVRAILVTHGDSQCYEVAFEREPRPKLACTQCGLHLELGADTLEGLQNKITRSLGFELDVAACKLQGSCRKCRRQVAARALT